MAPLTLPRRREVEGFGGGRPSLRLRPRRHRGREGGVGIGARRDVGRVRPGPARSPPCARRARSWARGRLRSTRGLTSGRSVLTQLRGTGTLASAPFTDVTRAAEQTGGRACLRAGRPPAGRPSPPPAAPGSGCGEGTRGATAVLRGTGKTGNSRSDDLARGRPGGSAQAGLRLPHGASWAVRVLSCPCGGGVAQTCLAPREPAAYLLAHGAFLCVCSLSLPSRRPRGRWAWTDAPRGPTTVRPPPPVPGAAREGIRGGLYPSWSNGRLTHHCSVLSARIAGQK